MSDWSVDRARQTYSVPYWSEGYFDIDTRGRVVAQPRGPGGPVIVLDEVVAAARAQGLRLPLLLRFSDILRDRLARLQAAFARAMQDCGYAGGYTAVYPIKVNQHHGVTGELVAAGQDGQFGLEAGSKPELMAVLALSRPGGIVVCNGYKDREYIRLALIGRKLGLETFIVVEKPSELEAVIEESRALGVRPGLGVRMRLATLGSGKWQNSGGEKAKFGLSPRQLLDLVQRLGEAGLRDALQLLHFHMGSQISNVRDIAAGMREATRYLVEVRALGCPIRFMDVGGGLGVDYEGTRSRGACSINYGLDQYAHTIVQPLADACAEHGLPPPRILTESGRALTAHHAVLIANVSEVEPAPAGALPPVEGEESLALRHLRELHARLDQRSAVEVFHDAQHYLAEGQAAYVLGQIGLAERARLDDVFHAIAHGVRARLRAEEKSHRPLIDELDARLVDKYFVNFSVFESVPDVWAIDQVFPILPIHRLDEAPTRRGVIADLTCDSDGQIDLYVDDGELDSALPLHWPGPGGYRIGIFMVGAYQDTLGDIHNLFGDTSAVNVSLTQEGYALTCSRRGDTADVMLDYVGYDLEGLRAAFRDKVAAAGLDAQEGAALLAALEAGLTGYTYLDDGD
ncbi:MAG: biosynthetic arginine decarboxylase [Lysobacteraceae bacterium]|nr:MAG: biosynthetic arginine decarboxylase [Xanthomonadaceae bacterium]